MKKSGITEIDVTQSFNQALRQARGGSLGAGPLRGWIMKNKLILTGIGAVVATAGIIGYRVTRSADRAEDHAAKVA